MTQFIEYVGVVSRVIRSGNGVQYTFSKVLDGVRWFDDDIVVELKGHDEQARVKVGDHVTIRISA